ncbi:hypothetical protein HY768_00110 [candidate division TA06 bacterium]|uniref:PorV/PorQ family protein n=1 Tax=candidate division TA06 bacterium TaxID=2250710 RepID=A0A933MH35_UNCT6|nr:hypothetical protein [candidate division TA06 bacterium]
MNKIFRALNLVILMFLGLFSLSAASEFWNLEPGIIGARSAALGGADAALADEPAAIFYNPAGLGQIKKKCFAAGLYICSAKGAPVVPVVHETSPADPWGYYQNEYPWSEKIKGLDFIAGVFRWRNFTLAGGYSRPYRRIREYDTVLAWKDYSIPYKCNFQADRFTLSMAVSAKDKIYGGFAVHFYQAQIYNSDFSIDRRSYQYDSINIRRYLWVNWERSNLEATGSGLEIGLLAKPANDISLGFTLASAASLEGEELWDNYSYYAYNDTVGQDTLYSYSFWNQVELGWKLRLAAAFGDPKETCLLLSYMYQGGSDNGTIAYPMVYPGIYPSQLEFTTETSGLAAGIQIAARKDLLIRAGGSNTAGILKGSLGLGWQYKNMALDCAYRQVISSTKRYKSKEIFVSAGYSF